MLLEVLFLLACNGTTVGEEEGDDPAECIDGLDNDSDESVDCDDSGCSKHPDCSEPRPPPDEAVERSESEASEEPESPEAPSEADGAPASGEAAPPDDDDSGPPQPPD